MIENLFELFFFFSLFTSNRWIQNSYIYFFKQKCANKYWFRVPGACSAIWGPHSRHQYNIPLNACGPLPPKKNFKILFNVCVYVCERVRALIQHFADQQHNFFFFAHPFPLGILFFFIKLQSTFEEEKTYISMLLRNEGNN